MATDRDILDAIDAASLLLEAQGIKGCLVGTGGLWLRGIWLEQPPDLDFAVVREPTGPVIEAIPGHLAPGDREPDYHPCTAFFHGVRVEFVQVPTKSMPGLPEFEPYRGIATATIDEIIGWKRRLARPKDLAFLRQWDRMVQKVVQACETCGAFRATTDAGAGRCKRLKITTTANGSCRHWGSPGAA